MHESFLRKNKNMNVLKFILIVFQFASSNLIVYPKNPSKNLIRFLAEISRHEHIYDVYIEFSFNDTSFYYTFEQAAMSVTKYLNRIGAIHFNKDDIPFYINTRHVLYTDSLFNLR